MRTRGREPRRRPRSTRATCATCCRCCSKMTDTLTRLEQIVRSTAWLMEALAAAREVDAPDWLIGSGAVRTAVWDRLHGYDGPPQLADVDLAFFDPDDISHERELGVERQLQAALPVQTWDVKNQARVHLWYAHKFGYEVPPLASSADGVAT